MPTKTSAKPSATTSQNMNQIDIPAAAKSLLGFPSLRPGQEEAILSLLNHQDTLVVQPTGSGKSAIYQIAGGILSSLNIPGIVVIISPLIALQKDQADAIGSSDLEQAAILNSTLPAARLNQTLDQIKDGSIRYLLLAPEQLHKPETIDLLKSRGVALFVIDEAHCVSQWGYDFRPDYLELIHVIETLGHPPTLAMTATASNEVREEIIQKLGLHRPHMLLHGFDRPNISLRVDSYATEDEKREALLRRVEFADTPGIIYTATHQHAESIAQELQAIEVEAICYHGGLKPKEREAIQNKFMAGHAPVIVATNAFGMGIDKPDIRFVYHADVSDSLDSYYQEIGRAGRDGQPAEAILFYRSRDIAAQAYKSGSGKIDMQLLEPVLIALTGHEEPITPADLAREADLSPRKLINTVHKLEELGAAEQLETGEIQLTTDLAAPVIAAALQQQQQLHQELRKHRLEQIQNYAEGRSCRREHLLRYFGDAYTGPCGNCDRCEATGSAPNHTSPSASSQTA